MFMVDLQHNMALLSLMNFKYMQRLVSMSLLATLEGHQEEEICLLRESKVSTGV